MTDKEADLFEKRPFGPPLARLREAGLRPTRQRLALARLLFDQGDRHLTAEALHAEALKAGVCVSLATIYNTLHQFTEAGLLRQVVVDGAKTYFDTNIVEHHHFFVEEDGILLDIPGDCVCVTGLPPTPEGCNALRVDVIVRVSRRVGR